MRGYHETYPDGNVLHTAMVTCLERNSKAEVAGLAENDQIVAVDGMTVRSMEHKQVVELFRGKNEIELKILSERERESDNVQVLPSSVQILGEGTLILQMLSLVH